MVFVVRELHIDVGGARTPHAWRNMTPEERRRWENHPRFWLNWEHFERNTPSGTFVCCKWYPWEVFTVVGRGRMLGTIVLLPLEFDAPGVAGRKLVKTRTVAGESVFYPNAPMA